MNLSCDSREIDHRKLLGEDAIPVANDPIFWASAILAASLVGLSKGGLNALGTLGVPVLALAINPVAAAGLLLPVFVASDVLGIWAYRREFDRKVLLILFPAGLFGTALGWLTARSVSEQWVTAIIGVIGVSFSLNLMARQFARRDFGATASQPEVVPGLFWGTISGFTSFVAHAGAPPFQVYAVPLGLNRAVFAGTTTIFFAIMNASKIVPYWHLGQLNPGNLAVSAVLLVPAFLCVFVGVWLVKKMSNASYYGFVAVALLVVSMKLLWDAFGELVML